MKLPTENTKGDEQPVGEPGNNVGGGTSAEAGATGAQAPASTGTSSNNAQSSGNNAHGATNQSGNPENVDFSEYLWMENEEEFDSQVLQELEDEEMINYYYELYEASLNENGTWGPNTANIRVTGPPPPFVQSSAGPPEDDAVDSLAQGLSSGLSLSTSSGSRLNPEAAEFVPRTTNMSSPN